LRAAISCGLHQGPQRHLGTVPAWILSISCMTLTATARPGYSDVTPLHDTTLCTRSSYTRTQSRDQSSSYKHRCNHSCLIVPCARHDRNHSTITCWMRPGKAPKYPAPLWKGRGRTNGKVQPKATARPCVYQESRHQPACWIVP